MTRYLVSFHVRVDAADPTHAIHRTNMACGWPGDYSPPAGPLTHETSDGVHVATVVRSQALMVKEAP